MVEYERLHPGSRTPWDAVVVTVMEGFGRTVADIAAVEQIACHPLPVHQALEKAAALRDELGLRRIVVLIENEKLWRSEWGRLLDHVAAQAPD
jgi:hypothetical protein